MDKIMIPVTGKQAHILYEALDKWWENYLGTTFKWEDIEDLFPILDTARRSYWRDLR